MSTSSKQRERAMQTSTDKSKSAETPKAPNGAKPAPAATAATAAPAAAGAVPAPAAAGETPAEESAEKRRGPIPTMPAAMLYRQGGRVYAAIHHPVDGSSYVESGKGEGSAMGALVDSGFRLSSLTLDGPEWLAAKLPTDAVLIGYASIKGFPLPTQ